MLDKSVIFFDIDGTLLDEEKKLPTSTKEAIFQLKELGHIVAIATGRAPFMFEELREELDIHTYVCFNGQLVVVDDQIIYTNPLNNQALQSLTLLAEEKNHPIIYIDLYGMKANVPHHDFIAESMDSLQLTVQATHDPDYFRDKEIFQSLLFCRELEEEVYERNFKDFQFVRWHPLSVDVDPFGGTKAKGIEKVMENLGCAKEQLFAFGDGLNDIDMLSFVPNSVAMGNGEALAKQTAKYITKSACQDGIAHGLKMVGLL